MKNNNIFLLHINQTIYFFQFIFQCTSIVNNSSSSISEDNMEAGPSQQFSASTLPGLPGVPELAPIMKPDIVFFGEGLGDEFHNAVAADKEHVDLLIMIGSSLKVIYVFFRRSAVCLHFEFQLFSLHFEFQLFV